VKTRLILMTAGMMALTVSAIAIPPYLKVFQTTYKIKDGSNLAKAGCKTCHVAPPELNPYGLDVKKQIEAAKLDPKAPETLTKLPGLLKKIEKLDSDKDGATNIAEIKADTLPGDPDSKPAGKPGKKP
jgi:hypothetical protein